ncbi:DODA-type extradiol aromatic ring-opening family dioxygenase [Sessilibacter corallicola]|uniref:DODA-type extradiol aromatic ring-opening family dioxygenase n=1 Tax=Sessilibacter corallicola TaxID=2904075 RepID=UPI001E441916|nr:class III extradiol ring-cleavage dioxygenase [Sessilibacter corallicola]MCE2027221.1 dioxygenase [Sessilibacter corallicola]
MAISTLFISHGGGPLPLLGDRRHEGLIHNMREAAEIIEKPDAIIVVSAHWEEKLFKITSSLNPELIYDYYGFPEESYQIKYPVQGNPQLAQTLHQQLTENNLASELDANRGLDHGVFVPLKIMFPNADIPCLQISINTNLSPAEHIKLGEVLSELHDHNILVLGSGFSFHNMQAFYAPATGNNKILNEQFDRWLNATCTGKYDGNEINRQDLLENWEKAPGARFAHPREEHLLPLHVCYGCQKRPAIKSLQCDVFGYKTSSFVW